MFRVPQKSPATAAAHPRAEQLRQLVPFEQLSPGSLDLIAGHCRLETRAPGPVPHDPDQCMLAYLLEGRIAVTGTGPPRTITPDSPGGAFPLPLSARQRLRVVETSSLLWIPQRYLALTCDKPGPRDEVMELHEGGLEEQLYLDFHRSLQEGECELPSMPDLAVRIGKAIDDSNTQNSDIARLIQLDPALAARVMSVVNSAAFGPGHRIPNLQQAVARLGRQQIRNLVFSFIIRGVFRTGSELLQQRMKQLWSHSCHVAAVSFILARHTPGLDPDRAMLAGLIHDIGVVPILDHARNYPELIHDEQLLDRTIDALRGEIGALTLRQWHFEDDMLEIALHAEDWTRVGTALADYLDVVLVAQIHTYVGTPRIHQLPPIDRLPAFRKLAQGRLTPGHSLAVLERAAHDIEEVRQLIASS